MKKTPQILLCLSVVGVVLLAFAPPAHANCTLLSQVVLHGLGGVLECAEPALGTITAIDDPFTTSIFKAGHPLAGDPMLTVCNANAANGGTTDAGGTCQTQAGTNSDNAVTIQFDWGAGSFAQGCPNPGGSGSGTTPLEATIVDANGDSVTLTVGFSVTFSGFLMDNAHINDGSDLPLPIACDNPSQRGNLELLGLTDLGPTTLLAAVNVKTPDRAAGVYCDCDTGALGTTFADQSCGSRSCGTARGRVYSRIGPCSELTNANFMNAADWTLEGEPNPTTGDYTVATDPSQLEPNCLIGPDICLTPPSAFGTPCTSNAECAAFDDCQFIGASNLLGPVVAGTCDPPHCTVTDIGPCTELAPGFVRCAGDFNVACTLPAGLECLSGACDIGGATCTLDSECPGECLTGAVGESCTTDAECSSLPESYLLGGGVLAIGGPAAASDRAVARLAELDKNVLKVEFTVSLEENALSFDILADGRVLNDSPIMAENLGTYVSSIAKAGGKLKGAKAITVRTNLDGGGTLMSEPLAIKKGNK